MENSTDQKAINRWLNVPIDTIIEPPPQGGGEIVCQERLGGLLKFYKRAG